MQHKLDVDGLTVETFATGEIVSFGDLTVAGIAHTGCDSACTQCPTDGGTDGGTFGTMGTVVVIQPVSY